MSTAPLMRTTRHGTPPWSAAAPCNPIGSKQGRSPQYSRPPQLTRAHFNSWRGAELLKERKPQRAAESDHNLEAHGKAMRPAQACATKMASPSVKPFLPLM